MKFLLLAFALVICISLSKAQGNTTENVTSTPEPTISPPVPTAPEGSWSVTSDNITCIRAVMRIQFEITIKNETSYLVLPSTATTNGSDCNGPKNTQLLILNSDKIQLTFVFQKEGSDVELKNATLVADFENKKQTFSTPNTLFSMQSGHYFVCKSSTPYQIGEVIMNIIDIKIQAFVTKEAFSGFPDVCAADDMVNDVVPIAVACALAGLIIIVLIAYLIGRRRSRQKGYNSV